MWSEWGAAVHNIMAALSTEGAEMAKYFCVCTHGFPTLRNSRTSRAFRCKNTEQPHPDPVLTTKS